MAASSMRKRSFTKDPRASDGGTLLGYARVSKGDEQNNLLQAKALRAAGWKLDRLSRSLKDVLHIMERIAQAGAGFLSITENIDTTTPAGRMMMQMVGAFAEFERAMIRERVNAGLARAKAKGVTLGRPKVDAAVEERIRQMATKGIGKLKTARGLGIGVSAVQRVLGAS
jgi:DNA invertase Pin-like site-specific DNA recombinase